MIKITCGEDCGKCYVADFGAGGEWAYKNGAYCRVTFCPVCGRKLGFTADGTPTIGASYAELEKKAAALDKLDADGPTIDGNGTEGYWTSYGNVHTMSELANAIPDAQEATPHTEAELERVRASTEEE